MTLKNGDDVMEWLMQWNENYSLAILLFGILACVIYLVVYSIFSYKKLLQELNQVKHTNNELQSKSAMIEHLSRELASQIEQEVAQRLKSDYAHDYLFESSLNATIIAQDEDLKIIKYNRAAFNLFGTEMLNYNILELFKNTEQKLLILEQIEKLKRNRQKQNFRMQLDIMESTIPVMASIHFFEFAQKTTLYFIFIDISDVAKLEEELQNHHLMLTQKTKEEEMGRMLGNVAHQWKQPLNTLYLVCQNLKEMQELNDLDDATLEKYLQIMTEQIKFMLSVIEEFRSFYVPSREKENLDIYAVIKSTLDLFYSIVDNNISIKFQAGKNKKNLIIHATKSEFQNVIIVLLDKAIEAIKMRLKTGAIQEGRITIRCALEENVAGVPMCAIYIKDNGGGIDKEIARKVFNKFFTTKESGTGIGLSIVQMLVESMKGRITFLNEQDGVEFKVEFPLSN